MSPVVDLGGARMGVPGQVLGVLERHVLGKSIRSGDTLRGVRIAVRGRAESLGERTPDPDGRGRSHKGARAGSDGTAASGLLDIV